MYIVKKLLLNKVKLKSLLFTRTIQAFFIFKHSTNSDFIGLGILLSLESKKYVQVNRIAQDFSVTVDKHPLTTGRDNTRMSM